MLDVTLAKDYIGETEDSRLVDNHKPDRGRLESPIIKKGSQIYHLLWSRMSAIFMLTKNRKKEIVSELKEKLQRQKIVIFSDFCGISVAKLQTLRRILKKDNAEYKVARKTIFDRALNETGIAMNVKELKGELGVVFGYGDEVTPAKNLLKFSKANETFKVLGGILNKKILSDKEIVALAKLPGKEMLIAQLLGVLQGPMRGLVTVLGGNIRNLAIVLNKIKEKK